MAVLALRVLAALVCLLAFQVCAASHGYAEAYQESRGAQRSFGQIDLSNEGPEYRREINFADPGENNGPNRPNRVSLALDAGFTWTAYGTNNNVLATQDGPYVGDLNVGNYERMVVTYEAPPSFGPQLPTYDESEIANDVSSFRDLIYAGFMPFAPGSGLIAKRDESGSASKGSNCYAAEGSYQQTCSPGIWAVKGDALDEDCWLCAKCPSDGGPEATSCTQAFDYCSDISNDLQKIACHGGCNPNKIQYIAPAFPVVQPIVRDDPGPLGERVKNYASSLAGLNEGANCNVMIIQQETYSGEPDEISGYSRKETSNFESSNTFDIYIFDKATFTNTGDGGYANWAWVGNVENREDTDRGDTVTFGTRGG